MACRCARLITNLLLAALIGMVIISCTGRQDMSPKCSRDFSSVAEEQKFWEEWEKEHADKPCLLQPFFRERERDAWEQVNKRLVAISKAPDVFVLVIRTNIDNGKLDVVALTKKDRWQGIKWDMGEGIHESVVEGAGVEREVLKRLVGSTLGVDASDIVFDADSVYMFVRYNGRCSRYAIYNPKFDSDGETQRDPCFVAAESLLRGIGMAPATGNHR